MRLDPGAFPGRDETGDRLDRLCNLVQEIARRQDEITRLIGHPQERPEAERPPDVTHSVPPTERISKFVADEGHVYRMNSRHENRVYYECWTRKKTGCNARISMDITTGEITRRDRAHVSDMCREEHFQQKGRAKQELERVKQWVCSEYTASHGTASCDALHQKVINQFFKSEFSGEYCVAVTPKTVQKWVSETRVEKPAGTIYQLLQKRREQDSNVEHEWLRMADEACGSILLFMTGMQEQELVGVDYLLIDGSFKSCPHGWSQYLNIMGVKSPNNQYFPVAHILLNGKKKEVYIEAFRRLLMFIHDKLPTQIMIVTDFEQALQEAVVTVFTSFKITVRVLGCLFHFSQAIMKKYQAVTRGRNVGADAYWTLKILLFAPFLSMDHLKFWSEAMMTRQSEVPELILYFRKVWVAHFSSWWIGPQAALMPVLTNCAIEGYHGKVNRAMMAEHPNLEHFAETLLQVDIGVT